ncbi:hypothetical protein FOY91_17205 [Sphingomonas solaris]|uniref:Lytic transglycosylase domain-containing protein n=1 Tax=Alterirhizorhabdus solaris TaxID=2529389 RepID=A0A558QW04_9SPHN|nr:hypothetical protein FOY91_17205 [Sphingomonas solaris]
MSSGRTGEDRASVRLAIADAAQRTGASFSYLLNQAKSESGLNPNAKAGNSSATGLYQFIDQSWLGVLKQHGSEHGYGWAADAIQRRPGGGYTVPDGDAKKAIDALRRDPTASALMAGEYAQDNAAGLRSALGRETNATDLYFGHFLGLAGAKKFLKAAAANPDAPAASIFPREAAANHGLFYTKSGAARSFADLYALMGRKIDAPVGDDAVTAPIQMASLAASISPTSTALSDTPPSDVKLVDLPASTATQAPSDTMLALTPPRDGTNMLRPSPKNAMLAYLMVSNPFEA